MTDFIEMCELHSNKVTSERTHAVFYHFPNAEFQKKADSDIVEWEWYYDDADEDDDYDYGTCSVNDIVVLFHDSESMRIRIGENEMEILFAQF